MYQSTCKGDVNACIFVGGLKAPPELTLTHQKASAVIYLATKRLTRNGEAEPLMMVSDWQRIRVYGRDAEFLAEHGYPGMRLFIRCQHHVLMYDSREDGGRHYLAEFWAQEVGLMGPLKSLQKQGDEDNAADVDAAVTEVKVHELLDGSEVIDDA